MAGWFAKLFPAKTLEGVREPTPVRIYGRLLSPNTLVSPLSGYSAALILWRFYTHFTDRTGQTPVERHNLLFSCTRGEDIILTTDEGTVLVPAQGRVIRPSLPGRGVPLDVPLPPEAAHMNQWSAPGLIFYDELLLRTGELVQLRATVAPCGKDLGSGYRSSGAVQSDFEALPHLGKVVLEELPSVAD